MDIFNNLCRACNTAQDKLLNIYTDRQGDSTTIKTMLEYCLLMPIYSEVMYPELICYFCVKQLEISYRFLQRFKLAQKEFENSYKHIMNIQDETKDIENDCKKVGKVTTERSYNEYNKLPEHPQTVDAIKIKSINITDEHLESLRSVHTIEKQSVSVINTAKSRTLPAESCTICNKIFFTTKALHLHLKLSHKEKISITARKLIADKCKMVGNLNEKSENKSNIECNGPTNPRTEVEIKLEYTQSNVFPIEVAQFIPAIIEQKSHVAKNCSVCGKSFFTIKALNLHLKLAHK